LGLHAHALNRIHHIRLLRQECVSQVGGPLNIARHTLHHIWIRHQSLDTWVPRLFRDRIRKRLVFQVRIVSHPLLELDDFKWISRGSERLRQK
jgi:hypothetical protein